MGLLLHLMKTLDPVGMVGSRAIRAFECDRVTSLLMRVLVFGAEGDSLDNTEVFAGSSKISPSSAKLLTRLCDEMAALYRAALPVLLPRFGFEPEAAGGGAPSPA